MCLYFISFTREILDLVIYRGAQPFLVRRGPALLRRKEGEKLFSEAPYIVRINERGDKRSGLAGLRGVDSLL